jgi:stage III sporulation protein SpoIIIAA
MSNHRITDNLDSLFDVLPPKITQSITGEDKNADLIEVILDLGRVPTARFSAEEIELNDEEITRKEIDYVVKRIRSGKDNHVARSSQNFS